MGTRHGLRWYRGDGNASPWADASPQGGRRAQHHWPDAWVPAQRLWSVGRSVQAAARGDRPNEGSGLARSVNHPPSQPVRAGDRHTAL